MKSALLSYEELGNLLKKADDNIVLLDATFVLPNTPIDPYLAYQNKRIDTARFFDIEDIADHASPLPHMLPSAEDFAQKVGALGITNKTHIIIYGQTGIALGPARVWWMFRTFGHQNVQILNGCLQHWEASGYEVSTSPPPSPEQVTRYEAYLNQDMVADIDRVAKVSQESSAPILDARPPERFSGKFSEPRPGMKSGHIPNSLNIPTGSLIDPQTGGLKPPQDLSKIISEDLINTDKKSIMTCGSGVTACVIALAFYELGNQHWSIFDGSWSQWGQSEYPCNVNHA